MRNASIELKKLIDKGALFTTKAHIDFADGKKKDLSEKEFYSTGNSFTESAGMSALPYGETVAKSFILKLVNDNEQFSEYDFGGAKISLSVACTHNGIDEIIPIGKYTVIDPESYGDSITISAVDDMYKGNSDYTTSLTYPQTVETILQDSCTTCGVTLGTMNLKNKDFLVNVKPEGITHRQLWGYIAMLGGGNARFDENNVLQIIPYDLTFFTREGLDGGTFSTSTTPYSDGDNADGGNFRDYTSGDTYDGGTFEELNRFHTFYRGKTPTIATDDVIVTGVNVTVNSDEYISGNEGYVLTVSNPLIEGNEINGTRLIGENVIGMRFRPFSMENMSYPLAEFGDICYVSDRKGNFYQSVVTDITFNFFGYTSVKCSADNPIRNSSSKVTATDSAVRVLRKETQEAIEQINDDIEDIGDALDDIDEALNDEKTGIFVKLEKTESDITAEVTRAQGAESELSGRISVTAGEVLLEASRAQGAESELSGRISVTAGEVASKVTVGESYNGFTINKTGVHAEGTGAFTVNMTNFSLDSKGNAKMKGEVTAQSGKIGPFTIGDYGDYGTALYNTAGTALWENTVMTNTLNVISISPYKNRQKLSLDGNVEITDSSSTLTIWNSIKAPGIRNRSSTATANIRLQDGDAGWLAEITSSSERYKHYITDIQNDDLMPDRLYDLPVRQYIYNADYLDSSDNRFNKYVPGFIAEDMDKIYPIATEYDEFGRPENWSERYIIPPMMALIQEQHKQIMYLIGEIAIIKKNMEEKCYVS